MQHHVYHYRYKNDTWVVDLAIPTILTKDNKPPQRTSDSKQMPTKISLNKTFANSKYKDL